MLLLEMLLVVHEVQLPVWFLPDNTAHDLVAAMHRLFPAFMNGCRCITGAFYVDRKAVRVAALETLATSTKDLSMRVSSVTRALLHRVEVEVELEVADMVEVEVQETDEGIVLVDKLDSSRGEEGEEQVEVPAERAIRPTGTQSNIGIMGKALKDITRHVNSTKEGRNGSITANITAKLKLLQDPTILRQRSEVTSSYSPGFLLLRDICGYLLVRYMLVKAKHG